MNNQLVISNQEIEALTGYKLPSKQCEALSSAGIRYIRRPDGRPSTTREWIAQATHQPSPDNVDDGFNLGALNG
ncbi:DUF4224 domain-containing protein [Aeromonas schubertii]|uniref:DUF4224 domain-containing protein n=1 Tax=Aeromonas schubertii TaxID=652 RepID=UPI0038B61B8B